MTSSSSSSTSVSSSEYASTCSTAAGEDALALLDSPSAIAPLYDDVRRTGEPSIPGVFPVAMSKNFSNVLGWYRQLRRQLIGTGSGSPRFPPTSCGAREAARWLLLLAFTMWFAPGHYTAWIDRLEMVCSSTWARATREQLLSSLASSPSHHLRAICKSWLPTEADVCVPATTTSSSSPRFSIWRAVSWELRCTGWILRRRVKGFQIWFHRKELIQRALNTIHPDHRDHLLSRQDLFDAYLMEEAGITFSDVDERVVVEAIVRDVDSKNYHGWEHRAWFLDHFPFLCRGPTWMELLEHWSRAAAAGVPMKMEGFVVDVMWLARPGTGSITWLPTDSYPVLGELDFTATRLPDDPWNNSVWSAHMSVWVDHFIRPLLHEYASVEGLVGCEAAMKMLHHLALPQMTMALQWAVCHPCNQPPLFSARVVAEKFHTASLRLMLFHHLPATEEYAHIHGALLKEVGSLANARCSATDASFIITGISAWISPASYLSTFALMELYEDVLVRHVCPAADGILDEVMELLGVEDEAERQERVRTSLYSGEATQFILDHCFEPTAARYHSIFVFLHETWLMYFTDVQRANIARDHPLDADHLGTSQTPTPEDEDEVVGAFLRKEREALRLARELREFDPIRAKYWRNEVFVVLHRRY